MAPSNRVKAAVVFAPLAVPLFLLACNQIAGITDYNKVDFPPPDIDASEGSTLPSPEGGFADGGREAGDADDAGDAPEATFVADVQIDALPEAAATLLWARWPMPNPHDAGVDANLSIYSYDDAGSVTDDVTHLVWMLGTGTAGTFADAYAFCATSPAPPGQTWRLPTRIELASLLDWTRKPTIDPSAFPDAAGGPFWTWSVVAGTDGGAYWSVGFDDGLVRNDESAPSRSVRCVRNGP